MIVVERDALNPESDMHFNLIDILLVGYITWGIRRGRQRGLTNDATRAVLLLLAVLTGYSLVRWTGKALGQLASITGQGAGPLGVLGIMIATYVLARHFITANIDSRAFLSQCVDAKSTVCGGQQT
jgi:hypothetical protein